MSIARVRVSSPSSWPFAVFVVTLPLVNPLAHGDGIGYYAYLRVPLIQHNLRFEEDWRHANLGFPRNRG